MSRGSATAARAARSHIVPTLLRAGREFAAVPLMVIGGFCVLATLAVLGAQTHVAGSDALRKALSHVVGAKASSSTLQAIATGLVTVTSITFSVLLLAVQQTASNLSPVVFDQFVRRRANQVFLGFFVGLALFAYLVMAAVQDQTPPIIGAFIATILTILAMVFLLALVYTTIDQMRPVNVLRQIHDRVLVAREREAHLVRRTMRAATATDPVRATYRSKTTGYVIGIDLERLEQALDRVPRAQIELHVTIGEHVTYHSVIATVYDDDEKDAQAIADEVRGAVLIGRQRDPDHDATTGIDQIANIAWTSGSTAKQNPEIAREAMDSLKDIAARLLSDDPAAPDADTERARIVYPDNALDRVFEVLLSLAVVAYESRQHMQAARVLETFRDLVELADGERRQQLADHLQSLEPIVEEIPASPRLKRARARAQRTVRRVG
jgi:uncharacterized membrane protein